MQLLVLIPIQYTEAISFTFTRLGFGLSNLNISGPDFIDFWLVPVPACCRFYCVYAECHWEFMIFSGAICSVLERIYCAWENILLPITHCCHCYCYWTERFVLHGEYAWGAGEASAGSKCHATEWKIEAGEPKRELAIKQPSRPIQASNPAQT